MLPEGFPFHQFNLVPDVFVCFSNVSKIVEYVPGTYNNKYDLAVQDK